MTSRQLLWTMANVLFFAMCCSKIDLEDLRASRKVQIRCGKGEREAYWRKRSYSHVPYNLNYEFPLWGTGVRAPKTRVAVTSRLC